MYRRGDRYSTKKGRTYFFISHPGRPEGKFKEAIETYANALVNTNGGILVFGVDGKETVRGFDITRELEDLYKCSFDRVLRNFKPTIHPHQYRLDVLHLNQQQAIFEIRISAGDTTEIYENANHEMYVVRDKRLYGPLFPCEIAQIVLQKYKEEISTLLQENLAPSSTLPHKPDENGEEESQEQLQKKIKVNHVTWP